MRSRILVVDDDPLFRSLIVALLRKEFDVTVAGDGSEAFHKSLEQPPDLAVVDVQMPGWDGIRTLRTFRTHPQLSTIPFVMLTADLAKVTILAAVEAGASDYIVKTSFQKQNFLNKINRLLELRRSAPAKSEPAVNPLELPIPKVQRPNEFSVPYVEGAKDLSPALYLAEENADLVAITSSDSAADDSEDERLKAIIDDWE